MTISREARLNPISLGELAPTLPSVGSQATTSGVRLVPKHAFKSQDVPGYVFTVLNKEGVEIGIATALMSHDRTSVEDVGHFGIELDPSVRGRGIGMQIAQALLSLYRDQGIHEVLLAVDSQNESVARSCRQLGGEYLDEVAASANQPAKVRFVFRP